MGLCGFLGGFPDDGEHGAFNGICHRKVGKLNAVGKSGADIFRRGKLGFREAFAKTPEKL